MHRKRADRSPMTTPQISGKYQFRVELKERRLPVTFTVPDIPDTPPPEEYFDPSPSLGLMDKGTGAEETSSIHTQRTHADADTDPVDALHLGVDQSDLLSVSAYLLHARTTGRWAVEHGHQYPQQDTPWKGDKVPVVLSTGKAHTSGKSF
jgi:hypothetical protein